MLYYYIDNNLYKGQNINNDFNLFVKNYFYKLVNKNNN